MQHSEEKYNEIEEKKENLYSGISSASSSMDEASFRIVGSRNRTGKISTAICKNIAERKDLSFIERIDDEKRKLYLQEDKLVRGKGKQIYLSNYEHKILIALSFFITQTIDNDGDVKELMMYLSNKERPKQAYLSRVIDLKNITRFINNGSSRKSERESVLNAIKRLADTYQYQKFKVDGNTYTIERPLVNIASIIKQEGKENEIGGIEIMFSPIFFAEAANKYAIIKPKLFELWGKRGNGTESELFPILLADLCSKYRQYYLNAVQNKEEERRKNLTYKQSFSTLKERTTSDYDSKRQYKSKFKKDLKLCIESLINYGIITDETRVDEKNEIIYFSYNIDFASTDEYEIECNDNSVNEG